MRRFFTAILLLALPGLGLAQTNAFYVSPTGNDANAGTSPGAPFATLQKAVAAVKAVDKSVAGATVVTIESGTYSLTAPLAFDPTAGGNAAHPVTFKAATGATVLVSGGVAVTGWTPSSGKPYFQKTLVQTDVRDLYVAGERRTRARTNERITGINWVRSGSTRVGLLVEQGLLPAVANPAQLELHMQSEWRDAYVPVQTMTLSNGAWDLRSNRLNEVATLNPAAAAPAVTLPFFVENALELLDQPGEWFFDRTSKNLYYYPKAGEDIASLEVVVPVAEKLIDINGPSLASKVGYLTFDGLRFAHTAWNAPTNEGWYGYQAEMLVRPSGFVANPSTPPGAINVNNASNIQFLNCHVRNTGASGIAVPNGVNNSLIEGCYFFDNGGAGIQVSNRNLLNADATGEEAPKDNTVRNNLLVRSGASFYGSPGISSFYTDGLIVDHNTVLQMPYIGISVGFGWTTVNSTSKNNRITNNKVDGYMATVNDGGGIYTLGNQPNSLVENNYIRNGIRNYGALYFDEGSRYLTVRNNVIETAPRWLHIWTPSIQDITLTSNWSNTAAELNKGTNISYEAPILVTDGNWPAGAQAVMANAGFAPSFTGLTALLPPAVNAAPTVSIEGGTAKTAGLLDRLSLKANVTDDGNPFGLLHTRWSKKSGPGTVTFPTAEQTGTLAFFSIPGTYELEFEARDNGLLSTKATVQVEVTPTPLSGNLALNKAAMATSSYDAVTFAPAKGVDGNVNTEWVSGPGDASFSTWTLDFGSVVAVQRLELDGRRNFNFANTRQHLLFEIADEPSFANAKVVGFQGKIPFEHQGTWAFNLATPTLGRYVRLSHTRAGDNNVTEFRAFGAATVAVSSVSVSPTSATFAIGETRQLTEQVIPSNASNPSVSWTTSNPAVATVSSSGLVTAVRVGTVTITATTTDGNKTATATLTVVAVNIPVQGVAIVPASVALLPNRTQPLTATVSSTDAINKTLSWTTSNPAVATVNGSGVVRSVAPGTATITATTEDGGKTATSAVTVTAGGAGTTSSTAWQSFQVSTQTGRFRAEFDVVPNSAVTDALVGLQNGTTPVNGFGYMSCIVRFSGGVITAHNGSYMAATTVNYVTGKNYFFRLEVDVPAKKYSVYVTPEGGSEVALGLNYSFRNATVSQLTGWTITSAIGTHTVRNMAFTPHVAPLSLEASSNVPSACVGGSVNLSVAPTGGTAPYSYAWTAPAAATLGATDASAVPATLNGPGVQTFQVTVSDSSPTPLVSTATVSVTGNAPPTATLTPAAPTLTCANPSLTLTAGGGTGYVFSGGGTPEGSDKLVVTNPGTYSVTVTNANGCTASVSATVGEDKAVPTATLTPASGTLTCTNPSLTFTASGGGSYTFSGGGTPEGTDKLVVTSGGTYSVAVTGANGCTASASATVAADFTPPPAPNVGNLTVQQNTPNATLTVTNCPGTVSWNGVEGTASLVVSTSATGAFTHTVACKVGTCTSPVTSVTVTVTAAVTLRVRHKDGDNNPTNNQLRPYLQLVNEGNTPVAYGGITLRYWLTVEEFAPLTNLSVYWAQLGTSKVKLKYVALPQPRQGAFGYVEYSFDASAGNLAAGANSGEIQVGVAKQNWTALNESDDYSHAAHTAYTPTDRVTVYQDGNLVSGVEPALVAPVSGLKVLAQNKAGGSNQIKLDLKVVNDGNVPADYGQLTVRYWFSSEGNQPLVYTVDYAELGNANVKGKFVKETRSGTDTYLEVSFVPALGQLNPLSTTGVVQQRVNKSDWSNFNEANDYSRQPGNTLVENAKITAYLNGVLVYGVEPTQGNSRLAAERVDSGLSVVVLGNPVESEALVVEVRGAEGQPLRVDVTDAVGRRLTDHRVEAAGATERIRLPVGRASGLLLLRVSSPTESQAVKVMKP